MKKISKMVYNILKAFAYQCRTCGFIHGFFIDKNSWGIFSKRSHLRSDGQPKISYSTEIKAVSAANSMNKKYNKNSIVPYKCVFCDGWHIGNNQS